MCTVKNGNVCAKANINPSTSNDNLMETDDNAKNASIINVKNNDVPVIENGIGNDFPCTENIGNLTCNRIVNNCVAYEVPDGEITVSVDVDKTKNVASPPPTSVLMQTKITMLKIISNHKISSKFKTVREAGLSLMKIFQIKRLLRTVSHSITSLTP
ncbi:hypothetical protein AVEN_118115-1 [Araneus ventricosus]|uniref:Uncharacterized protein n=1 Tax=Araneus ventricosus TaxID=182803 RepID=A0A4Y2QDS1_ARAVE|nr:hypothetical protein AVEN_118115-1 [Araneus ventricosus]